MDVLDLYREANERRKRGVLSFVDFAKEEILVCSDYLKNIWGIPSGTNQLTLVDYSPEQKSISAFVESSFLDEEEDLSKSVHKLYLLADILSRHYGVVAVVEANKLHLKGAQVVTVKALKELLSPEVKFRRLIELSAEYEITKDGSAIVLDGIAYVSVSNQDLQRKVSHYYIEGYMSGDKVIWTKLDPARFKATKVFLEDGKEKKEFEIKILETLHFSEIYSVYKYILEDEKSKVIESPYPIAILQDGTHAFFFDKNKNTFDWSWSKWDRRKKS